MTASAFEALVQEFPNQHLLVIGDLMVDRYITGDIQRISPEAPVPVFQQKYVNDRLGGAGNVVRALRALGAQTSFIGVVGFDAEAILVQKCFDDLKLVQCYLIEDVSRCTSLKTRYIAQNQQILRVDHEKTHDLSLELSKKLLKSFDHAVDTVHAVILSDYAKGVLTTELTAQLIAKCRAKNVPVFVDPKAKSFAKYQGVNWVTPNRQELLAAVNQSLNQDEDYHTACQYLIKAYNLTGILATRSEQGMSVITGDTCHHLKAQVLDVFDVSGAGDTVLGAFALAICAGAAPELAADISNHGAGVVVAKSGTATVTIDELLAHIQNRPGIDKSKILSLMETQQQIFEWHRHGLSVGFTNGCFDILHPGHVTLLKAAKNRCDRLVLGLNSDESVKRLKGPGRPVHDLHHRAQVLEALESLDAIVVFTEDTPLDLINALNPDILFKGSDYTIDQVAGAQNVINRGGRVELLDLVPGHSTTATVEKLRQV